MLEKLNKIAVYLAMALLGYVSYSATESSPVKEAQGKEAPVISKKMIRPAMLSASQHASPVGRDPFEVEWASYISRMEGRQPKPEQASQPSTRPATEPATRGAAHAPVPASMPAVPARLASAFIGDDVRMAIIDDKVYKPGSLVGGTDPTRCWMVESIEQDSVVLRFGEAVHVLRIVDEARPDGGARAPARREGKP